MKNAIILHGRPGKEEYYSDKYPSASNSHWLPWLQKQLLMRDIPAQTPTSVTILPGAKNSGGTTLHPKRSWSVIAWAVGL